MVPVTAAAGYHRPEPGRGRDDAQVWAAQMGRQWAHRFDRLRLPAQGMVVEIGPGFSAKIGLGLADVGFQGTVLLVEPNAAARRWACGEYRRLLPGARVLTSPVALPAMTHRRAEPVDLLAANHILDDLILHALLPAADAEDVFAAMHAGSVCSEQVVRTWGRVASTPGLVDEVIERVVADLVVYLDRIRPAHFVINDYPSWRHSGRGLHFVHDLGVRAIRRLAGRLDPGFRSRVRTGSTSASILWLISSRQVETEGEQT